MTDKNSKKPFTFNGAPDRSESDSLKWGARNVYTGNPDILPFWVADMDFPSPPAVIEALVQRAEHGVFGYPMHRDSYHDAVISWVKERFGWDIEREWLVFTPGVVTALHLAVQAFTQPGDGIVIQPPVYDPFRHCVEINNRRLIYNPLRIENGRYVMNLDQLSTVIDEQTRLFILCSPHNPVGRVWSESELLALAKICLERNVIIISDEIHADLVFPPFIHRPMAALGQEIAARTVTFHAPSKTFNVPGLQTANAIIPNPDLRRRFFRTIQAAGINHGNIFGLVAAEAGYRYGHEWLTALLEYIKDNYEFLRSFFATHMPKTYVHPLEGSYLAWVDFSAYGLSDDALREILQKQAEVWFLEGTSFGPGGEGFQRINLACPRSLIEQALWRVVAAFATEGYS